MRITSKLLAAAFACVAFFGSAPQSFADDSEIFTNAAFLGTTVRPNVMFIIDTSGSMDTVVNTYDETRDYLGGYGCDKDRLYWTTTNSATPPDCLTSVNQSIKVSSNVCRAAFNGIANSGWWNGRAQQIITGANPTYWGNLVPNSDNKVECQSDSGNHGDREGSQAAGGEPKYARNGSGNSDSDRWGNSGSSNQITWNTKQRS